MKISVLAIILTLIMTVPAFASPSLSLGPVTVSGTTVSFPVTLAGAQGYSITGIVADILFNRSSSSFALKMEGNNVTSATPGTATVLAGKQISQSSLYYGDLHIVVYGINTDPILDGIIAQISFNIDSSATSDSESFAMVSKAPSPDGFGDYNFQNSVLSAPPTSQLTVTMSGNGGGSVNSNPPGFITCTGGSCSANLYTGSTVTLMPSASITSNFGSWSGNCAGSGNCTVSMTTNRTAVATFVLNNTVRVGTTYFGSLSGAYGKASNNSIVQAMGTTFYENLDLNRGIAVTLEGGYESTFKTRLGFSTIDGTLTVSSGNLVADRLILQ